MIHIAICDDGKDFVAYLNEQGKIERKVQSRDQKEAEKERQYAIRQEKKKAKHRDR